MDPSVPCGDRHIVPVSLLTVGLDQVAQRKRSDDTRPGVRHLTRIFLVVYSQRTNVAGLGFWAATASGFA